MRRGDEPGPPRSKPTTVSKVLFSGGPLEGISLPIRPAIAASACKRVSLAFDVRATTYVEAVYELDRVTEGLAICRFLRNETHERDEGTGEGR